MRYYVVQLTAFTLTSLVLPMLQQTYSLKIAHGPIQFHPNSFTKVSANRAHLCNSTMQFNGYPSKAH